MTFPTTSILDNFNRSNEGPPPSANWSAWDAFFGISDELVVLSNACQPNTTLVTGSDWWNADTPGPDCEVYCTLANWPTLDVGDQMYIILFLRLIGQDTAGPNFSYYHLKVGSTSPGTAYYQIKRITQAGTTLLKNGSVTLATGDAVGMDRIGDTLTFYRKPSGGSWGAIDSVVDGSPLSAVAGRLALEITPDVNGLLAVDDFGGGTVAAGPVAPTADFSGTPTSGAATLDVDFTDLSTGTPTSWLWDFGDGDTSTSQNPSHSYTFIGVYTVALTATNDQGSDTETKADYIVVGVAPAADFSGTPTSGDAPLTVDFTDLSTGDVTDWLWDFGDGGSDVIPNATHVYAAAGTYTVALTVTGPAGTDTETKVDYITVTAAAAPVADFSADTTSGAVPLTVNFTDLSTNTPTSWLWLFGDGASDTVQNPTHIYSYVGTYTVTLTATNATGSDDEVKVAYITVTAVVEYGAAVVENCDIDTGGLAVGIRVADVAIARDNRLGSVVIDASAELRVKDNSYTTLTNSGTFTSLAGDRSVWDVANFPNAHASDIDGATWIYHLKSATTQAYTISNPATDRAYDVTATTLNEIAAVLGTLIGDLQAKGILG